MDCQQPRFLSPLFAITLWGNSDLFAVDDDVVEAIPAMTVSRRIIVQPERIDQWVFGNDPNSPRRAMENQIFEKIHHIKAQYELTPAALHQLTLAARIDKMRFESEVDQLRQKLNAAKGDLVQVRAIAAEASLLRQKLQNGLGPDSFFEKAAKKILEGQPRADAKRPADREFHRRQREHIEDAVRSIERHVRLPKQQRLELLEFLIRELVQERAPAEEPTDYQDILMKYRISRIPRDKLMPLFDKDQWPGVREVLDGFLEFGPVLARYHMLDQVPVRSPTVVSRIGQFQGRRPERPADATVPENTVPENAAPQNGDKH